MTEPRNEKDLAKKIIKILSNKNLRNKIIKAAYKKSKNFDVKLITKKYIDLYEKVLSKKNPS